MTRELPHLPEEIWAQLPKRSLVVELRMRHGPNRKEIVVDQHGRVAGVIAGGHDGVDPEQIDFTTDDIEMVRVDEGGIWRWLWGNPWVSREGLCD